MASPPSLLLCSWLHFYTHILEPPLVVFFLRLLCRLIVTPNWIKASAKCVCNCIGGLRFCAVCFMCCLFPPQILETAEGSEASLMDRDLMQVVFSLARSGHAEHVPTIVDRMRHERGYVPGTHTHTHMHGPRSVPHGKPRQYLLFKWLLLLFKL